METVDLRKEEDQGSDVNVYITIDPASLKKYKEIKAREAENTGTCTQLINDVASEFGLTITPNPRFLFTERGFLMGFQVIVAIISIIISATTIRYDIQTVALIMHSITLACISGHLLIGLLGFRLCSSQAIGSILQMLKDVILFILQLTSFIVVLAGCCGDAAPISIFGIIQCCCLIWSMILIGREYSRTKKNKRPTKQKRKGRRTKVSYKPLKHRGGY